jgi:aminoglycoside phosphotransferase (APT) family kinase protein
VVLHADAGIDGLPFKVMERVPGSPMLAGMATGEAAVHEASVQLGRVHAQLHSLPVKPVIAALENSGFGADEFSAARQVAEFGRYFEDYKLEWLRPGMDWLVKNRPADESLAVCHGDFHPANIMVESGKVTGVIHWPGAAPGCPEHDVRTTVVLIKVAAAVYPVEPPMLEYVVAT